MINDWPVCSPPRSTAVRQNPRLLRRSRGELYEIDKNPCRAAKHCRKAEPPPFRAESFTSCQNTPKLDWNQPEINEKPTFERVVHVESDISQVFEVDVILNVLSVISRCSCDPSSIHKYLFPPVSGKGLYVLLSGSLFWSRLYIILIKFVSKLKWNL